MLGRHAAYLEALPLADGDDGLLDLGALGQHPLSVGCADVVQVDIDREMWDIEDERGELKLSPTVSSHVLTTVPSYLEGVP